ncbi:alpha-amylase family glycosyl hydrolase [Gloeobacter kilaueensis]|nr:alpha-amylase family glycosyl hydrolase [Gloeobacter kilaueensis]
MHFKLELAQFKIFFPKNKNDKVQYFKEPNQFNPPRDGQEVCVPNTGKKDRHFDPPGENYGETQIQSIQVVGSFQAELGPGLLDWDTATAPSMNLDPSHPEGEVWTYQTDVELPAGFYEYKYYVTFRDGGKRFVGDPCARYGGTENQNSAFVIGGSRPAGNTVTQVVGGRKSLRDLVIYELMIDDFTDEYRGYRAPLRAVVDKLDYLKSTLGINAILFLPWTAWPNPRFNWGYIPYQYFSVEFRYTNDLNAPAEKLSLLKKLITECHQRGIHVIMDGVFNHIGDVEPEEELANGFPYRWLYQDPQDCPFVGRFGGLFPGLVDLDYNNTCTQEFIEDVCRYWIDNFNIDGIRFDNTPNYWINDDERGLPTLLKSIRTHVPDLNFSLTLEHLSFEASYVVNQTKASSYWNNGLWQLCFEQLQNGSLKSSIVGALNTHVGLEGDRVATLYISNHDHSHVAWQAGVRAASREYKGSLLWYRTQPYAIALFTSPGVPMIQNGQEFAEDYWLMEDDEGSARRVKPRPLRWDFQSDNIGKQLLPIYAKLIEIRLNHPSLRSDNFYPSKWEDWQTQFDPEGYGVSSENQLLIYHRWGSTSTGTLERFIVVLNFSDSDRIVDVPFPDNGNWQDLLDGRSVNVSNYKLLGWKVTSNWGNIFFK